MPFLEKKSSFAKPAKRPFFLNIVTYIYYHFPITRSMRYQTISHTLCFMLHCTFIWNNVVLTMVFEMVEILDGRVVKCSVEGVRYVINNLLNLIIVKYGVISLVLCICTHLWLVKILTLLMT